MARQPLLRVILCCADSLDGSSNEKEFRQYEKWTAEEEHIFFLKLSTVSSLSLLDGFRSIAHHLPNKNRDQVILYTVCVSRLYHFWRLKIVFSPECTIIIFSLSCMLQVKWYFYRLKGQFQKHNPDRDVEDLSQKETFQAMSLMWSEVSSTACCGTCISIPMRLLATILCLIPYSTVNHGTASQIAKISNVCCSGAVEFGRSRCPKGADSTIPPEEHATSRLCSR